MQHGSQPAAVRSADQRPAEDTAVAAPRFVPESLSDNEDCDVCLRVLTSLQPFGAVRAVKAYRLRVELTPPVPHLPCLDHEAMLHEGIAPHAAAYVEERESGELHEIVLTPSKHRVEIDVASTLHEHTTAGRDRLLSRLREQFPQFNCRVNTVSWLRGDRRVARACRAQVTLREVLAGTEYDAIAVALDRLRTVGSLMEKESRVASWSVRTVTGPFLAVMGNRDPLAGIPSRRRRRAVSILRTQSGAPDRDGQPRLEACRRVRSDSSGASAAGGRSHVGSDRLSRGSGR